MKYHKSNVVNDYLRNIAIPEAEVFLTSRADDFCEFFVGACVHAAGVAFRACVLAMIRRHINLQPVRCIR